MNKFDLLFEEATKSKEQFVDEVVQEVSQIVKNTLNPANKQGVYRTNIFYIEDASFRFKIVKFPGFDISDKTDISRSGEGHVQFALYIKNEPNMFDYLAAVFHKIDFSYGSEYWINFKKQGKNNDIQFTEHEFGVPLINLFKKPYHTIMSDIELLAGKLYDQHYSIEHRF